MVTDTQLPEPNQIFKVRRLTGRVEEVDADLSYGSTEEEEVVKRAPTDPKLRNWVPIALHELAPSVSSQGISRVTFPGGRVRATDVCPLTRQCRLIARQIFATPSEVTGRVEIDASGRATLLKIARLKLIVASDNTQQQIEFKVSDESI